MNANFGSDHRQSPAKENKKEAEIFAHVTQENFSLLLLRNCLKGRSKAKRILALFALPEAFSNNKQEEESKKKKNFLKHSCSVVTLVKKARKNKLFNFSFLKLLFIETWNIYQKN